MPDPEPDPAVDPRSGADPERLNRNVARGAATRQHLIDVATSLFAARGYEDTSIEAVLARGRGQPRLAVPPLPGQGGAVRGRARDHGERHRPAADRGVRRRGGRGDHAAPRLPGLGAIAGDPVVRQVLLIDAPAVLGWDRWRSLEERHALGLIKALVGLMAEAGDVDPALVDMFSHVVLAAINEIALMIALADDPSRAQRDGAAAIDEVLDRLLGTSGS